MGLIKVMRGIVVNTTAGLAHIDVAEALAGCGLEPTGDSVRDAEVALEALMGDDFLMGGPWTRLGECECGAQLWRMS